MVVFRLARTGIDGLILLVLCVCGQGCIVNFDNWIFLSLWECTIFYNTHHSRDLPSSLPIFKADEPKYGLHPN